ncbi:DUF551 domain-containing protein [Escherichia coli]|nr:DUF551 domain-containing protein [Escherichia coli]MBZ8881395.1 DUF551 domain-containing protein [Escherichia coli]MBZ8912071.1 DUF551 domain-containing protein [Escherichia coli]MBZ9122494.1 DUF551 domain-containing protein [Escherichia coli]MBZ9132009.1 DUF551 domain-containing protein [Escherichia coli]
MTTITKERLLTIKQWRETYGPGSNVVLPAEEAEELARIALAALEAEPVAWTDEEELRDVRKYGFGEIFQCPPDKYADPRRVISLYRELPAPVVPDDWQLVPKKITLEMECALSKADSYEIGWLWALAAAPKYEVQNAKRVQNALNACRAAMLQGSQPVSQTYKFPVNTPCQDAPAHIWLQTAGVWPEDGELSELTWCSHNQHHDDTLYVRADLVNGNSPVTPDGWISCSERMPNDAQWCVVNTEYGYYVQCWSEGQGWLGDDISIPECDVINWMPLPEPPQEVK